MSNTFIKIAVGFTAAVAAISCGTAAIAAMNGNAYCSGGRSNSVECTDVCYTDNDGDGVCDNRGTGNGNGCYENGSGAGHHGNGGGHHGQW